MERSIPKNTKSNTPTTSHASKPVEVASAAGKLPDPKTAAPSVESVTPKDAKPVTSKKVEEKRRILSVVFPGKTLRQLKLLASIEGTSIASIVVGSVTRTVNKRLPSALENLKSDLAED